MAGSYSKLADKRFRNWIKSNLAGNIAKEGIEDFVSYEIHMFHEGVISKTLSPDQIQSGNVCRECTTENIIPCPTKPVCIVRFGKCTTFHTCELKDYRRCPKNICDKLREEIKRNHKYNNPSWKNTHAKAWCDNSWEIAKCYLPPDGYLETTSVIETDLNGILSIILNHKMVSQMIDENTCSMIRDQNRKLRHSPNLCIEDHDLDNYLDNLVTLLTCSEKLLSDTKTKQAVCTIQKLKADTLSISTKEVADIIDKAIEDKTHGAIQEIDKTVEENLAKIKASLNGPNPSEPLPIEEERYQVLKQMLKDDLIYFNGIQHRNIPLFPLFEDDDGPLLDFYIAPNICSVETDISISSRSERRHPIESLHNIFQRQDKIYSEIYLTANAGFGKTVFGKHLALTWCHAHKPTCIVDRFFSQQDICLMENFEFLFLVSLRDAGTVYDVDDMILHQVLSCLSHSSYFTIGFLQEIFHREKCMIILDGLDEWTHPVNDCLRIPNNIPHRKARKFSTVITTSRPWKLSSIRINKGQIDRRVEISGLDEQSRRKLIRHVISKLSHDETDKTEEHIERFHTELLHAKINCFETLIHLICLWCDGTRLGSSKCELLCNIIELMLMRAAQKSSRFQMQFNKYEQHETEDQGEVSSAGMPNCFHNHEHCMAHYQLLISVGKLAFKTLFCKRRESTLSFDRKLVENILTPYNLSLTFFAGILTQNKNISKFTSQALKVSFVHRTFQDFFAALHIHISPSEKTNTITEACSSVDMILEMSDFLVFTSSLAPKVLTAVSQEMVKIVGKNETVETYRSTLSGWLFYRIENTLKAIQNLNVTCLNENMQNGKEKPLLQLDDFILDKECQKGRYLHAVKELINMNKTNIKSLVIREENVSLIHEIISSCELEKMHSLVKLYIRGNCRQSYIDCLLLGSKDTLKYVTFVSCSWKDNYFKPKLIPWAETSSKILLTIQHLEGIGLDSFSMTHKELEVFVRFLAGSASMKEISLFNLKCSDHLESCDGFCLNLCSNKKLKVLEVRNVPLSEIKADVSGIQECLIGQCCTAVASTAFLNKLSAATQLQKFTAAGLKSTDEIDEMLEIIPKLDKLQTIGLWDLDLLDRHLKLSPTMLNIEYIILIKVKFPCTSLQSLVNTVENYEQSVKIDIVDCEVWPEEEFEKIKTFILTSSRCVNTTYGLSEFGRMKLSFETLSLAP